MRHRHLDNPGFSPPAIDDVIARGSWRDWVELRRAALGDPKVMERIGRIARARAADPYSQRFHFWMHYVEERRAAP